MTFPFSAIVSGCYVAWSPSLAAVFSRYFPSSDCTLVKIGRSRDIYARLKNLNGIESRLSRGRYAVDRDGYAHVTDWMLWRLTTIENADERIRRERELQDVHSRVGDWIWRDWHRQISPRKFVPAAVELFVARPAVIDAQFFMPIAPLPIAGVRQAENQVATIEPRQRDCRAGLTKDLMPWSSAG